MSSLLDRTIGDYRLVDFLGAGGMGEVYRAVHTKVGRVVAIKVLTKAKRHADAVERFLNEARIQAKLQHPNIAVLYDFVEFQGQPCIIMEYVDGETLAQRLCAFDGLPLSDALSIFRAVVDAICYMHARHIVHRDIKPANIKISAAGPVKLLDFGIAKDAFSRHLTTAGSIIGTLRYLSPEQIQGKAADARSDIWALGVLLYEMLTGRLPFDAADSAELLCQIARARYAPPVSAWPGLPGGAGAIISRCLRKNPAQRYPSAQALLTDVQGLIATLSAPGRGVPTHQPMRAAKASVLTRLRDNWALAVTTVTLVSMLALGLSAVDEAPSSRLHEPATAPGLRRGSHPDGTLAAPTASAHGRQSSIRIDVLEGSAEVYQAGTKVGTTPFQFSGQPGERIHFTLKQEGSHALHQTLEIAEKNQSYVFHLEKGQRQ